MDHGVPIHRRSNQGIVVGILEIHKTNFSITGRWCIPGWHFKAVIQPEWIEALAGENTLTGNLSGVVFGVFMYFPTLVEVPIAQMFLELGMHRGPLLAYLMADQNLAYKVSLLLPLSSVMSNHGRMFSGLRCLVHYQVTYTVYGLMVSAYSRLLHLALFLTGLFVVVQVANRRHFPS